MRFSGLKAANGSWKTGCTSLKNQLRFSLRDSLPTSRPLYWRRPDVAASMPRSIRASVVLPLPLSPAMERISGLAWSSVKVASSTA